MKKTAGMLLALLCLSGVADSIETIREFTGTRSTTTVEFEVTAPWLVDWRVNGEFSNALGFEVALMDARTGLHVGRVTKTKRVGDGIRLFQQSGKFKLRIDASHAKWQILVQEITREEEELYEPR